MLPVREVEFPIKYPSIFIFMEDLVLYTEHLLERIVWNWAWSFLMAVHY